MVRRIVCIFNPKAGEGRFGTDGKVLKKQILASAKKQGFKVKVHMRATKSAGHCEEMACEAEDADVVVAVGGDGTVYEVANAIAETDVALGVIPSGSGNDTLRSMGVTATQESCIHDIVSLEPRWMDLGKMNDRYFVNAVGIGLDAEVNHETDLHREMVHKVGAVGVYGYSAVRVLARFKPYKLKLTIDKKKPIYKTVSLCTIGNGTMTGGGFKLTPKARMDDGKLDISAADYLGKAKSIFSMKKAYDGKHIHMKEVLYTKFKHLKIDGLGADVPYHIDGEGDFVKKFDFKVVSNGLKVVHRVHGN